MENSVGKNTLARITRLCEQSRLNPKLVQWKTEKLLEPYRDAKQIVRRNTISEERIVNRALCLIREKYHKYQIGLGHKTKSIDFIIMEVLGTEWAEKIIEKAKEANVPVHKDSKLAGTLSKLEIGDMIPPELYEVVAEILVFVDDMDRLKAKLDGAM